MISNNIGSVLASGAIESVTNFNGQLSNASTIVKNLTNKLSLSLIQDDSSQAISATSLTTLAGMIILSMDNTADKEKMLSLAPGELTPELEAQIHNEIVEYTVKHPFTNNSNTGAANFLSSYYQFKDPELKKQLLDLYAVEQCEPTNTKNVADTIDEYITQKTSGKITNMFDNFSPQERQSIMFAMGNVIDFKGVWEKPFDKNLTKAQEFKCTNGKIITNVNMMHLTESIAFASGYGFNIILKKFTPENGNEMQFVAIVPQNQSGQTVEDLNPSIIDNLIEMARNSYTQKVNISIPQVKIDSSINTLKEKIEAVLGVSINAQKLSKLGLNPAEILRITQKIKAKFDEEGTEIAVVSMMFSFVSTSMPKQFKFDKPGYMAITEGDQKIIETIIKDEKFLVTDGTAKYSTYTVPVQKKLSLNNNSISTPNTKKAFNHTSTIDNCDKYTFDINLTPNEVYTTEEEIEACCQQHPTIKQVMNLIPPTAQPYSKLIIEKYIINTKDGKIAQYLIKDRNTKCLFTSSNVLMRNGIPTHFTSDDCVTAVYSLNGNLEFKCEDIPKISPVKVFKHRYN
jgi:serpin B